MRLERLEISGFKSFSDRSELAFDRGVTAIVGPNGCGKSNVVDAITWVMGEQSAKSLRGERMEDVIFSGSDARKPTAAAEVRLRLSGVVKSVVGPALESGRVGELVVANGREAALSSANGNGNGHPAAYDAGAGVAGGDAGVPAFAPAEEIFQSVAREVEVTRRLYRSGESEYLIDGRVCRLRDIHDLLMDTGLGAKAYAIIEQGKIGLILSSRPTERRQIIEEAAGITKYRAKRRSAELKLEAARQNLSRVEDILFEVEKQRGSLKRQAAKTRRYLRLRDELRRWEKVLFARRERHLSEAIAAVQSRLADAREREAGAAGHLARLDADLARVRIELVEAEMAATGARERAHASEMGIVQLRQQLAFDRDQSRSIGDRVTSLGEETASLEGRREPVRDAVRACEASSITVEEARACAAAELTNEAAAYEQGRREIEGLEADVEAARSEVFAAINAATALRHSIEHAGTARERIIEGLNKLQVESDDLRVELDRLKVERETAVDGLRRAQEDVEATRVARAARESEAASARIEHEWRAQSVREREHELAALGARLKSLEELESARAEYKDAPRTVLARADATVGALGAVADYLDVDAGYERAAEAFLGDLLQHVLVEGAPQAEAGLRFVREQQAGRCGFLLAAEVPGASSAVPPEPPSGLLPLCSVVRVRGPFAEALGTALGEAWVAPSYEHAMAAIRQSDRPIVTVGGDLFRAPYLVQGGGTEHQRGILETRREIRELRERVQTERQALEVVRNEAAAFEATIAAAASAIAALSGEQHQQEKAIVGCEAREQRVHEETTRLARRGEQLARERRQTEEERDVLDARQVDARAAISELEARQGGADDRLTSAQRRLFEARESAEALGERAAAARASHAALQERATALASELVRLREQSTELETRVAAIGRERGTLAERVQELGRAIVQAEARLDELVQGLETRREELRGAEGHLDALRAQADAQDASLREARAALEGIRAVISDLDIARATAEADLTHLASTCFESLQVPLVDVLAEAPGLEEQLGQPGFQSQAVVGALDEFETDVEESFASADPMAHLGGAVVEAEARTLGAEEAIAGLRAAIDRLGPVNMMAVEQFEDLEARYAFLSTQREDLAASIGQTSEAIKRIDETTRARFVEAFSAINRNFQEMFGILFGGGRAGLTLLDENDPLESGIEIVAQPPGKRLQSVQLLSGGEKALTAISLMFGLFKYKPSPFCLLDEIDAPLDDANVGRFVEMLRSMQASTQFILITHHRKTMEIADRLYGVTMEEPGVSKLISVQLN